MHPQKLVSTALITACVGVIAVLGSSERSDRQLARASASPHFNEKADIYLGVTVDIGLDDGSAGPGSTAIHTPEDRAQDGVHGQSEQIGPRFLSIGRLGFLRDWMAKWVGSSSQPKKEEVIEANRNMASESWSLSLGRDDRLRGHTGPFQTDSLKERGFPQRMWPHTLARDLASNRVQPLIRAPTAPTELFVPRTGVDAGPKISLLPFPRSAIDSKIRADRQHNSLRRLELVLLRHQNSLKEASTRCRNGERSACRLENWQAFLADVADLDMDEQIYRVHRYVNNFRYVKDRDNWDKPDYWEVPEQLFTRGGDCEDYVVAKYISLQALGVPASRMRMILVYDKIRHVDHAVLTVLGSEGTLVLDNNYQRVLTRGVVQDRYQAYYALNENGIRLNGSQILSAQAPTEAQNPG